jgi:hypothetical protein
MSKKIIEPPTQPPSQDCDCDPPSHNPDPPGGGNSCDSGSFIDIDVGQGTGSDGGGSLIDLNVATEPGTLLDAQVAGGSVLDVHVGQGDDYSGIGLQVAALADQGLVDLGSDHLVTADVGSLDVGHLLDLGNTGLPDLPDIFGGSDCSSCC